MSRNQLSQLAVLAAVVAHGSFRNAAKSLAIAPSAVSHAVNALEQSLGVSLLARTTRSVAPTEAGRLLLERLEPALAEINLALQATTDMRETPSGTLRISVPRTAAHLLLAPRLGEFNDRYPEIKLDVHVGDRFVDIVTDEFDAGIRLNESLERDMIAVRLGPEQRFDIVASPAYLAQHGVPEHPDDLASHSCIRFRFSNGEIYRWELEKDGREMRLNVNGPFVFDDNRLVVEAALQGAGLAFIFSGHVSDAVADGRLVRVLSDWCQPFSGFYLYYPSRRYMRPALRAFIEFYKG